MKLRLIYILFILTLASACSDEEPQKTLKSPSPEPQKEDQKIPPSPAKISQATLGGKPIVTLDLNNAGQASLLRNANAQTPDELIGPAPSLNTPSNVDSKPSIFNAPRIRSTPGVLNTRIENNTGLMTNTLLKAIHEFTDKVDPALDKLEEIIQLEAAGSPDFINDDMNFLVEVENAKKLIDQPFVQYNKTNIEIATRIKRYQELTNRYADQLKMLSDIKISFEQLASYGYELVVVNDKYQWKEKEITISDGAIILWTVTYIKIDQIYAELTENQYRSIFLLTSYAASKTVGDYGKKYKPLMNPKTLEKWRTIVPLFESTVLNIKDILKY